MFFIFLLLKEERYVYRLPDLLFFRHEQQFRILDRSEIDLDRSQIDLRKKCFNVNNFRKVLKKSSVKFTFYALVTTFSKRQFTKQTFLDICRIFLFCQFEVSWQLIFKDRFYSARVQLQKNRRFEQLWTESSLLFTFYCLLFPFLNTLMLQIY